MVLQTDGPPYRDSVQLAGERRAVEFDFPVAGREQRTVHGTIKVRRRGYNTPKREQRREVRLLIWKRGGLPMGTAMTKSNQEKRNREAET